MRLYLRIVAYLRPYGWLVAAATLATLGFAVFDAFSFVMLIPFLNTLFGNEPLPGVAGNSMERLLNATVGRVVDLNRPPEEVLTTVIGLMVVIFLIKNVFDFFQQYLVVRLEQSVTRDLRNQAYRHVLGLDLRFFGRTRAGQIITRLTTDADQLRNLVTKNIARFATSVFQIVAFTAAMIAISPVLTAIALIGMPAMFGIWNRLLTRLRRGDRTILNIGGEVASHVQETVSGVRQVKAAAAEEFEAARFRRLTQSYYRTFVRTERLRALASPLTEMMGTFATVLLLWYGARLVLSPGSDLDGAQFIALLAASFKLYAPAKWLAKLPATIQPGLVAAERVFEFLDTPVESVQHEGVPFQGVREAIRFERVGFEYEPGRPVLEDVSFEVRAGEAVALVGPSGAGKSTLVDLVARFYDPVHGRITVDGRDLREYDAASIRARLGIVAQETVLFHDTVRSNIAYALASVTAGQVEAAARAANAHEFIERLPDGYDTILGERGTRLSGGQRQRLAIARALLRDPPILILDEATSALDSESERLVQQAIQNLLAGRTVFVIAHRLSTIRNADRILVLDHGRLVQAGRHDELLDEPGLYRHLYRLQFADEDEQRVVRA